MLNRCVVSVDPDMESAFELSDLSQEPCLFKVSYDFKIARQSESINCHRDLVK